MKKAAALLQLYPELDKILDKFNEMGSHTKYDRNSASIDILFDTSKTVDKFVEILKEIDNYPIQLSVFTAPLHMRDCSSITFKLVSYWQKKDWLYFYLRSSYFCFDIVFIESK